jgi:hypothetical protein
MRTRLALIVAAALLGLATLGATAFGGSYDSIAPPNSRPFGHTYAEWQACWNQWAVSIPASQNPGLDETGARCGVGQTGSVWFTSFVTHPGTTERTCVVPFGKGLFVLVASYFCSPLVGDQGDLRARASAGFDAAGNTFSMTVDGRAVENLGSYRSLTPIFPVALPENNILGVPAGSGLMASDGVFVMLAPLPIGTHRVRIHIDSPGFGVVDENYTIVVNPRGR